MSSSKKSLFSWALFDWADSSFSAIIQTFVFAVYFTKFVATNEIEGSAQWGLINALAAIVIAILGPILGAIADQGGNRKPWIAFFTYLAIISTALLWFVVPGRVALGLTLVCLGIIGSESAFIFYSAMLKSVAGEDEIGKWSGIGWGFGYLGGMLSLIIALFFFVDSVHATFLFCAAWFFLFSLPLFIWTKDEKKPSKSLKKMVSLGMQQLILTLGALKSHKNIILFLIGRMFFIDALTTLFAFGGIYAATVFHFTGSEILKFGILLHITAGLGAFFFAFIDDIIGSKKLMIISLFSLTVLSSLILLIRDQSAFWVCGSLIGVFVGPVQAASRSYMARMVEEQLQNQMFGFFAFSGKATAFLGPLLVGSLIYLTGSIRIGMSVICLFFIIGLGFIFKIRKK